MIRIAVCDDIPFHADTLAKGIACWQEKRRAAIQIMKFYSGEDLLFEMECSGDFSAVFLDIQLSGISGIETAMQIREQSRLVQIVFVSLYDTYFKRLHALCWPVLFLEKPVNTKNLYRLLDQIHAGYQSRNIPFQFHSNHHSYNINLHKVLYFVSDIRIVRAIYEDGSEHKMYSKLDDVERALQCSPNFFIRIHQSYLVNSSKIMEFHRRMVILGENVNLPVSRGRKGAIIQLQMNHFAKKC